MVGGLLNVTKMVKTHCNQSTMWLENFSAFYTRIVSFDINLIPILPAGMTDARNSSTMRQHQICARNTDHCVRQYAEESDFLRQRSW